MKESKAKGKTWLPRYVYQNPSVQQHFAQPKIHRHNIRRRTLMDSTFAKLSQEPRKFKGVEL